MILSEESGRYRITFELYGGERPVPRQRIEFIFVTVITFLRWISGREVHPLAVELAYPEPADSQPYLDAFGCRMHFNAQGNGLLFSMADLTQPLPTSNPLLAELHERFADEYLERFDHAQTSYRAREVIIRRLPVPQPAASVARAGGLPARLRRPEQLLPRLQALVRSLARAVPQPVARGLVELSEQFLARPG